MGRVVRPTLERLGLPHRGSRMLLRVMTTAAAAGTHASLRVELPRLVAELDSLIATGFHHVFLYRFPAEERDRRLQQLGDPAWVRARLEALGLAASYGGDPFVWDAKAPELTSVRYLAGPARLMLKWVESRLWEEKIGERIDRETGNRLAIFAPRRERSVNFFWIDLATGDSAIAIQELQPNARPPLQGELGLYREALRELFGFDPCDRVLLEPVARRLLLEGEEDIKHWAVTLPGGDPLRRGHKERFAVPSELQGGAFAAVEVEYDSRPGNEQETGVRVKVDARADYLEIAEPCRPTHHAAILATVRERIENEIRDRDLRALAEREPELRPVLAKLDVQLAQLGPERVDSRPLVGDEWLDRDAVRRVFEALAAQNPSRFAVRYYVYKPATKETGSARRLQTDYADPAAIPPEVEVRHKGERVRVPTAGNVWPELALEGGSVAAAVARWGIEPRTALAAGVGLVLLGLLLFLAIRVPEPKRFPELVFRVVLGLAAAGLTGLLPKDLFDFKIGGKKLGYTLRAAGALGVFAFVCLFQPPRPGDRPGAAFRLELAQPLSFERALTEVERRFGETVTVRCGARERQALLRARPVEAPTLLLLVDRLRHLAVEAPPRYEVKSIEGVGLEVTCPGPSS